MVSSSRSKITFDGHSRVEQSQACAGRVTVSLFFFLSAVNPERMRGSMLVHIFSRIHVYSKTKCDLKCLCKVVFVFDTFFKFLHDTSFCTLISIDVTENTNCANTASTLLNSFIFVL